MKKRKKRKVEYFKNVLKYATPVFIIAGIGLLTLYYANITGFVIANNQTSNSTIIGLGFIFFLLGLLFFILGRLKIKKRKK